MTYHNTNINDLGDPEKLARLTDADIMALAENDTALAAMTPLERELLIRLTALMESSQSEIQRLDDEISGMQEHVPAGVETTRIEDARASLFELVSRHDALPKVQVSVE